MSACFYDNGGIMEGIDAHTYYTIGPLGVPVPVLFTPHLAGAPFLHPAATWDKRTPTVLAEGRKMIKRGFKIRLVPHLPVTMLPPHGAELGQVALVIAKSTSTAYLGVASVTGEGGPLATCVGWAVGVNGNCGPGIGAVYNPSSVITSPTASDYAGAVAAWCVALALGPVWKKIPTSILRWAIKKYLGPKIDKLVRDTVDRAL